jgi:hypothetical protein
MVEVLMAMFIMAIGMMALLTLFPLGAVSMAQALKDDRCASTASMAENVAIAQNLRHDPNVDPNAPGANANVKTHLGASPTPVYIDPSGVIAMPHPTWGAPFGLPLGGVIPRVSPSFVAGPQASALADRWFSLPDDITFLENGTPDTITTGGIIDRGRRYSYAYLLTRPQTTLDNLVKLTVVVYNGRPIGALTQETTYTAPTNPIVVSPPNGLLIGNITTTSIKRGGWILDPNNGNFYRVTNIADLGGTTTVEVQPNLIGTPTAVTVMDNVAEVFDKSTGWQP